MHISEQHTDLLKCTRGVDSWVGCWNGNYFIKMWACFNLQVELVLQPAWAGQTLTHFTDKIQGSGRGELSVPADTQTAGCTEIHSVGQSNRPVILSASSRGVGYVHRALAGLVASYRRASSSLLDFIHALARSWPVNPASSVHISGQTGALGQASLLLDPTVCSWTSVL